jgi:hypothetical protein
MNCESHSFGCFLHKLTDKLRVVGNVTRDRKLADCNSEFHSHQATAKAENPRARHYGHVDDKDKLSRAHVEEVVSPPVQHNQKCLTRDWN